MQVGSVFGKVKDHGTLLSGALVSVPDLLLETSTDREGEFYFGIVPVGTYRVNVSYLGLEPKDVTVSVSLGQRVNLDVELSVDAQKSGEMITLEEFTISGQRSSQARALNQQRTADSLQEIVASNLIGRFPDQNAAESIQRLSGVALERDQGEGRFVSIRGITAALNNTQINGINVPSSERDTRKVNLDTISNEQLDGIELTKALTPDMDGDAIGGSINLKTKTAFSSDNRIVNLSAEGSYNKFGDQWGHKVGLTLGDKFFQEKWGILVTASDQRRYTTSLDNEQATGWVVKNGFYVPNGNIDIREYHIRRSRRGAGLSLDFQPTNDDQFFLRSLWNHFTDRENRYRMLFRAQASSATPTDDYHGTVANRPVQVEFKDRIEETSIWTVATGGDHLRGGLQLTWQAAFSHADLKEPLRFEPVFQSANTSFSYDWSDPEQPILSGTYRSLPLTSYRINAVRVRTSNNTDDEATLAANLKGYVSLAGRSGYWKMGLKFRQREKDADTDDNRFTDGSAGAFTLANVYRASAFNPGSAPFLTPDGAALSVYFHDHPGSFIRNTVSSSIGTVSEDYISNENVFAGYGMGSITFGSLTVSGGVRAEHTSFKTNGWIIQGAANPGFIRGAAAHNYDEILPGVHALYKFNTRFQTRASYNQSISRPNFPDSSFRVTVDDNGNTVTGNPKLKPYHADNFDLDFEFFPQKPLGVVTFGGFAKRIDDFIFTQTVNGGAGNGSAALTTPLNGNAATISGLEVTYQQQFTFLPAPFNGLGVFLNYTRTQSTSDLGAARLGAKLRFLQQSDHIANVALSYEKHGFFIRGSLNFRSYYLDTIGATAAEDLFVDDHMQIDVSMSYKFTRNLTLYAELLNVNREPYFSYYGSSLRTRKAESYKWNANVGLRFSL